MNYSHLPDDDELLHQEAVRAFPSAERSEGVTSGRPSAEGLGEREEEDGEEEGSEEERVHLVSLSEVSLNTLYALRRDHLYWCVGAGFALVVGQLLPSTSWAWSALRILVLIGAGLVGISRVWYLNGVEQEIKRREKQASRRVQEDSLEDVE